MAMLPRAPELRPVTQQATGEKQTFGSTVRGTLRRLVETTSFTPGILTSVFYKNPTPYFAEKDKTPPKPQEPIHTQSQASTNVPAETPDSLEGRLAAQTIEELAKTVTLPQVDTKPQPEQTEQKEQQG
jgi:hypothetical protein